MANGEYRIPRIQEYAPNFEAESTHGLIRLDDYTSKGRWVMLFAHPADFTAVCSTEMIELARRCEEFERMNVQLIGVSIDSVYSHIAWVRDLERIGGVEISFPLIADVDRRVSQAYGLIHEEASDTSAVRAVFAIDPKNTIRALLYYPMELGRNVDELLRMFTGLQIVDEYGVDCPANWGENDPVLPPAPRTQRDAGARLKEESGELQIESWYLARKRLPALLK